MPVQTRQLIQRVPILMKQRYGDYPPSVTALARATGLTRPTVKAWIENRDLETYNRRALLAWANFFSVGVFSILDVTGMTVSAVRMDDESL